MPTTTFSGPVKAGGISTSTGTTLSENVANQGFGKMVQVYELEETAATRAARTYTDIVIPANSQITRMAVLVTSAFGTDGYAYIKDSTMSGGTSDTSLAVMNCSSLGLTDFVNYAGIVYEAQFLLWKDTGASDRHLDYEVRAASATPDTGRATLIVEYVQNNNLTE